jgi:hypothetical protein
LLVLRKMSMNSRYGMPVGETCPPLMCFICKLITSSLLYKKWECQNQVGKYRRKVTMSINKMR